MRATLVTVFITVSAVMAAAERTAPPVPLRIDARGAALVPVHVNGAGPFIFVLDTGSSRSIVSAALARELEAPAVARTTLVGSAGSETGVVVRLAAVAVGSARVANVLAPVVDESRLSELGRGIRGVLGQDFLAAFNYTLDYRRARLTWDERVDCTARGAMATHIVEGRMVMALRDGRGDVLRLVADSGAEIAVLFTRRDGSRGPHMRLAGVTGAERTVEMTTIPFLRLGSTTLRDTRAAIVPRDEAGADGLLPLRLFARVAVAAGGACIVPVT
jgi:hypothetical protein